MRINKKFKLLSVLSAIISIILYACIVFQTISIIEFEYLQILLFCAEATLILTILFAVCSLLVSKTLLSDKTVKKIAISFASIVLAVCIGFSIYGAFAYYNCYTPENIINNDKDYIQTLFPFNDIINEDGEYMDLEVSYIPGTHYLRLYAYGEKDYNIEYFKSVSPFMNLKFKIARSFPTILNELDFNVFAQGEEIEVDGVKATVFVDGNDYAVLINELNQAVYASLLKVDTENLSVEDFVREIIKQFDLLETATNEKVFLDVPISEAF